MTIETTTKQDIHWGTCPVCGDRGDRWVDMGADHWITCEVDRVRWWVGTNLTGSWRERGPVDRLDQELDLLSYRVVGGEPWGR